MSRCDIAVAGAVRRRATSASRSEFSHFILSAAIAALPDSSTVEPFLLLLWTSGPRQLAERSLHSVPANRNILVALASLLVACGSSDDGPLRRDRGVAGESTPDDPDAESATPLGDGAGAAGAANGGRTAGTSGGAAGVIAMGGARSDASAAGAGAPATGAPSGSGGRTITDAGATPDGDRDATERDAASTAGGSAGCSAATAWYADADGDGFGTAANAMVACVAPSTGWVDNADDCDDHDGRVHPKQATYFATPYKAAGNIDSFDYDCSGDESLDPSQHAAPSACGLLSIANCAGSGYVPTARTGPGVNPLCGSVQTSTCTPTALLLCQNVVATVDDAARCR